MEGEWMAQALYRHHSTFLMGWPCPQIQVVHHTHTSTLTPTLTPTLTLTLGRLEDAVNDSSAATKRGCQDPQVDYTHEGAVALPPNLSLTLPWPHALEMFPLYCAHPGCGEQLTQSDTTWRDCEQVLLCIAYAGGCESRQGLRVQIITLHNLDMQWV